MNNNKSVNGPSEENAGKQKMEIPDPGKMFFPGYCLW